MRFIDEREPKEMPEEEEPLSRMAEEAIAAHIPDLVCIGCGLHPDQLPEYVMFSKEYDQTPAQFVQEQEGTLNPENGHFVCTDCYMRMGMPATSMGWVAP